MGCDAQEPVVQGVCGRAAEGAPREEGARGGGGGGGGGREIKQSTDTRSPLLDVSRCVLSW